MKERRKTSLGRNQGVGWNLYYSAEWETDEILEEDWYFFDDILYG